jgi:hypothetical protein
MFWYVCYTYCTLAVLDSIKYYFNSNQIYRILLDCILKTALLPHNLKVYTTPLPIPIPLPIDQGM